MKKTTFVALLLLMSGVVSAKSIMIDINAIESEWANIYYDQNLDQKGSRYLSLIRKIKELSHAYPNAVEPVVWEALVVATNAEFEPAFTALDSINQAKDILEAAIAKEPMALEGAAFVVLGTLYYMTPGWPISFGDEDKAERLLQKGLDINPDSIDANYFYADYLLSVDDLEGAQKYFKQAIEAPVRPEQVYADEQLKKEALLALKDTEQSRADSGRNHFLSLFFNATASN